MFVLLRARFLHRRGGSATPDEVMALSGQTLVKPLLPDWLGAWGYVFDAGVPATRFDESAVAVQTCAGGAGRFWRPSERRAEPHRCQLGAHEARKKREIIADSFCCSTRLSESRP